jgi:nitrogenase molybdenum-iron protein NifN
MAMVHISNKPLTVNPLKVSQPMGATLAVLGLDQAVPLQHGAQGCTAFSKVFFTRHFREPVALQTTAMDQVVTVMGADSSVVEALRTVAELNNPEVIGLMTTGLTETQGADIARTVKEFQRSSPEFMDISVIPINTPDTLGSLESGYARALEAVIEHLVPEGRVAGYRPRQVNVLLSSMLTPGDAEAVRAWVEAFGLRPVMLPDLGGSLDGHFDPTGFSTLSRGGVSRIDVATMGKSVATLAVGPSVFTAADRLKARTGVPDHRFEGLMGLAACDAFTEALAGISGRSVPDRIDRLREQLLDAMVDTHFVLGALRLGVAADPDHLGMLARFLTGVGIHVVAAVASSRAEGLVDLPIEAVVVGDLEDLEARAQAGKAQVLIANSHGVDIAERLRIPLLRAGFPLYDIFGGAARKWVGYDGSRQALFDLANLAGAARPEIAPYRSFYGKERPPEMDGHVPVAASGASTLLG